LIKKTGISRVLSKPHKSRYDSCREMMYQDSTGQVDTLFLASANSPHTAISGTSQEYWCNMATVLDKIHAGKSRWTGLLPVRVFTAALGHAICKRMVSR
jgi:hypothetical protein